MTLTVRPLGEDDLDAADRVFRLAFGTHVRLADPMTFRGDAEMVRPRWRAEPAGALGAFDDGELIGSSFAAKWGSFGIFGPLTVRPDHWASGVAKRLLGPTMELFDSWQVRHTALFTFPDSPKHAALYQKFGFWPQSLTAIMSKPAASAPAAQYKLYSELEPGEREDCLAECAALTGALLEGLDLRRELQSIHAQGLGDTLLLRDGETIAGFAACHIGKGGEAGSGSTYIKFGAVRADGARQAFGRLLEACEALAVRRGCSTIVAGVSTARHDAYRAMLDRGYRTYLHGVAMQRPNIAGYNSPAHFVVDDWR